MNSAERKETVRRWMTLAREQDDACDRFLMAWVALTIAAKRASTSTRPARRIRDYCIFHKHAVSAVLDRHRFGELKLFGNEKAPELTAEPTASDILKRAIWDYEHGPKTPEHRLERTAQFLVEAENQLMLGVQSPQDSLRLKVLTPLILDILDECEGRAV